MGRGWNGQRANRRIWVVAGTASERTAGYGSWLERPASERPDIGARSILERGRNTPDPGLRA
jgi:hypothetical protein